MVRVNIDRPIGEFESLVRIDSLSLKERETADYLRQKLSSLDVMWRRTMGRRRYQYRRQCHCAVRRN